MIPLVWTVNHYPYILLVLHLEKLLFVVNVFLIKNVLQKLVKNSLVIVSSFLNPTEYEVI